MGPWLWMLGGGLAIRKTPFIIFVFINSLFVVKFAERVTNYYFALPFVYLLFALMSILLLKTVLSRISKNFLTFCALCVFFLLVYVFVLSRTDPSMVRVDRWSAITYFLESLFSGTYPYGAVSHLGNPPSPFPMLFLIAMPFYVLGDVGLFQAFSFLAFGFFVYKHYAEYESRVATIFLLGTAPIFLWEVAVRSELFSNMTMLLAFLFLCEHLKTRKGQVNMSCAGALGGLVLSTRGIVVIPLILYFMRYFRRQETVHLLAFVFFMVFSFAATVAPFYVWNSKLFVEKGPFALQPAYIPTWLLAVVTIASVVTGLRVKTWKRFLLYGGYVLSGIVGIALIIGITKYGWHRAIYGSAFDISYFQFAMPFLLLSLFPESSALSSNPSGP